MAISFTSNTGGGTSTTYSVTVSGANPLLLCLVDAATATDIVTGITWNSETLSRVIWSNDDPNIGLWMYACVPVGTGAHNMVISLASGSILNTQAYLVAGASGVPTTSAKNNAVGFGASVSISGGATDWLVGYCASGGGGGASAGSNTTIRGGPTGVFQAVNSDSNGVASPTALSVVYGVSGGWSMIGAKITPFVQPANGAFLMNFI